MEMDGIYKRSLLYDFYGDLLTERQKEIYGGYVMDDLSLKEIADETEISRQGVFDMVKRCDHTLEEYESRLHLVERFLEIKQLVSGIEKCKSLDEAKAIADKIIDKL